MKKLLQSIRRGPVWVVAVVVIGALAYELLFAGGRSRKSYDTAPVSRGQIQMSVASSGAISPLNTVPVGSQVSGQLTEIDVDFNSKVRKGQLLAVVDPSTFRSKVEAAKADLTVQQATIGSNEVQVGNVQVVLDQAQRDFDRTRELADQGLMSTNDLEKARNTLEQEQNSLKLANAALNSSRALLVKVRSQLDQARIDLSHTEIRAPVDGVVIDRSVDVGQTVQSAMTVATLFRIALDLSQIQIETKVDEADIGSVQQAGRATFTVDAYPERLFQGRISQVRINGTATANVVTYSVMVQAANPGHVLLPGMTANVKLVTAQRDGVLRIPGSALRFRPSADSAPAPFVAAAGTATSPPEELTPGLMRELGLDAAQQAAATAALRVAAERIRANSKTTGTNPLGGGMPNFRRLYGGTDDAAANRQRLLNALATVLSPEQLQKYADLSANSSTRPAVVYVLDGVGRPAARSVRVGLSDDNYTEVISGLAEGERVVVRAHQVPAG